LTAFAWQAGEAHPPTKVWATVDNTIPHLMRESMYIGFGGLIGVHD
jgi:hypothetical protein